jgi:hypothetical protein
MVNAAGIEWDVLLGSSWSHLCGLQSDYMIYMPNAQPSKGTRYRTSGGSEVFADRGSSESVKHMSLSQRLIQGETLARQDL